MYIDGIGISAYRSFGSTLQRIGPFSKVNLFIGQNNAGKSNILRFLTHHYRQILKMASPGLADLDRHLGENTGKIKIEIAVKLGGHNYDLILKRFTDRLDKTLQTRIDKILQSNSLSHGTNVAWFPYEARWNNVFSLSAELNSALLADNVLSRHDWLELWNKLTFAQGGDIIHHWIPGTIQALHPAHRDTPDIQITLIPAIRRVGEAGSAATEDYGGAGLIDRLAQLQNPSHDQQDQKQRFEEINEFLRSVTGNRTADLEIPYKRDTILVHMDGRTLPLISLGTGIHEVIILASAATVLRDQVICIEEPELHLHPLLQKKLIRYLQDKTNNQYFITTHSAHLLDTPSAAIFHVQYQNGESVVDPAYTATEKSSICADLGYHASDLLQANCVIWVEGPSDRIYLNHWIHALEPDFIEGIHYSIMFYGGRLLSHLTASDPEVDDFISLRRLNRYISIMIDSDKSSPQDEISETKQRIISEFEQGPGFAWITAGREIENYIAPAILEEAVKKTHPQAVRLKSTGQFDDCLRYVTGTNEIKDRVDKVKIANETANCPVNWTILDLEAMTTRLVQFIRDSNDL